MTKPVLRWRQPHGDGSGLRAYADFDLHQASNQAVIVDTGTKLRVDADFEWLKDSNGPNGRDDKTRAVAVSRRLGKHISYASDPFVYKFVKNTLCFEFLLGYLRCLGGICI